MNRLYKFALLLSFLMLSSCNILWGPSDTVGNWPFESSAEKKLTIQYSETVPNFYPISLKLSNKSIGAEWRAKFSDGSEFAGPASIKLLRTVNGEHVYGFSFAFDAEKYPDNPGIFKDSHGFAVFGFLTVKDSDDSIYRISVIRCGDSEKIKQCETKTNDEAWKILASMDPNSKDQILYGEYQIEKSPS